MTIPWLMNCAHSASGWCLDCARRLGEDLDAARAELAEGADRFRETTNVIRVVMAEEAARAAGKCCAGESGEDGCNAPDVIRRLAPLPPGLVVLPAETVATLRGRIEDAQSECERICNRTYSSKDPDDLLECWEDANDGRKALRAALALLDEAGK